MRRRYIITLPLREKVDAAGSDASLGSGQPGARRLRPATGGDSTGSQRGRALVPPRIRLAGPSHGARPPGPAQGGEGRGHGRPELFRTGHEPDGSHASAPSSTSTSAAPSATNDG